MGKSERDAVFSLAQQVIQHFLMIEHSAAVDQRLHRADKIDGFFGTRSSANSRPPSARPRACVLAGWSSAAASGGAERRAVEPDRDRAVVDQPHRHARAEPAGRDRQARARAGWRRNARTKARPAPGARRPMKLGRLPLRRSAKSVNWLTTSRLPPTSSTERFILPASSSKMRSAAILRASRSAAAAPSPVRRRAARAARGRSRRPSGRRSRPRPR